MDGVLVIRKEKGYTSHDVVARLRGILRTRKIGHTGTLDPDAEGVLPVAVGKATKLVEMLTDKEKTYEAVLHLGIETDTQDIGGRILEERPVTQSEEEIRTVMAGFLGQQMQIPPMYSALKVNGRKLCDLAREGKTIERSPRPVFFSAIEITGISLPYVRFVVTCSKGTYIRTLCHDIGERLGCKGCMESLVRTRSGRFSMEEALTLSQVEKMAEEGTLFQKIIGIEEILKDLPPVRALPSEDRLLRNGNAVRKTGAEKEPVRGKVRMYTSQGLFIGIYAWDADREMYSPVKMFL